MDRALEILLLNSAAATMLALAVAALARWIRRPAVLHILWLAVLLKLITPPVLELGLVPDWARPVETVTTEGRQATPPGDPAIHAGVVTTDRAAGPAGIPDVAPARATTFLPPPAARSWRPSLLLAGASLWAVGILVVVALALARSGRFRRIVERSAPAPEPLAVRTAHLAASLGLAEPAIRLVDGRIPPMLRPRLGAAEILLPRTLLPRLGRDECDGILLHELAHLARRDHWVRFIEFAAGTLFWWHPVAWWARRRLRAAEEEACDALVLAATDGRARPYADGLLKTLDFMACRRSSLPAFATGAGESRHIRERLTMIMTFAPRRPLSPWQRLLLAALAVALLALFPTWAEKTGADEHPAAETEAAEDVEHEAETRRRLHELQRREMELVERRRALEADRLALQREVRRGQVLNTEAELRAAADRARAEGQEAEAQELAREAEALRLEAGLAERHDALEARARDDAGALELELGSLALKLRELEARDDFDAMAETRARMIELEHRLRDVRIDAEVGQREIAAERARREYERALAIAEALEAREHRQEAQLWHAEARDIRQRALAEERDRKQAEAAQRREADLERRHQELQIQQELHQARGEQARTRAIEKRAQALEESMRQAQGAAEGHAADTAQRKALQAELEALRDENRALRDELEAVGRTLEELLKPQDGGTAR